MPLSVRDLAVGYGKKIVVRGASLEVGTREVVALVGHNGAGKSTLLHGIFGILRVAHGSVTWNGRSITNSPPSANVRAGIAYAPQGAQIYRSLTVAENLLLGAYAIKDRRKVENNIGKAYELFPILQERRSFLAGSLSGGERQMLAIGAILAVGPKLILLDEPSGGLAPLVVEKVFDAIRCIVNDFGASVLLVEQNLKEAFRIADLAYVMTKGAIVAQGTPGELDQGDKLRQHFFGEVPAK
jgi:branched-chain amino acid transport system ATP-binding protein